jgi:hypothetical protein
MISLIEVIRAMRGMWLLFLERSGAAQLFDTSVEGFWRSFQAIALVAPVYAFIVAADRQDYLSDPKAVASFDTAAFFLSRAITVALDWVTLPILLAVLAPALGIRAGYASYVVVRNWGTLFTLIPYAALSLLELTDLLPADFAVIAASVVLAISLRVSYVTARWTLGVPIDVAIGYVALDFLVSLGLAEGLAYAFGVPGSG